MTRVNFSFKKTLETIVYLASNLPPSKRTRYFIVKSLYLADMEHLEEYGRLITGDSYVAMKNGPVPERMLDILRYRMGNRRFERMDFTEDFVLDGKDDIQVTALRDPRMGRFSESDLICLNKAIETIEPLSFKQVETLSHKDAWNKATNFGAIFSGDNQPNKVPLPIESLIDQLENADDLHELYADYCHI